MLNYVSLNFAKTRVQTVYMCTNWMTFVNCQMCRDPFFNFPAMQKHLLFFITIFTRYGNTMYGKSPDTH